MRGSEDQAAVVAYGCETLLDLPAHLVRRGEGERELLIDGAPEAKFVTVLSLQFGGIHASGLHWIQNVEADLDQIGDDLLDVAVGVVRLLLAG